MATPTCCSWLNLVRCFSIILARPSRRGSFTSVNELVTAIGTFIDHWNDYPHPFTRPKDADEILGKIQRAEPKTSALANN
jgi:hypothetical protein